MLSASYLCEEFFFFFFYGRKKQCGRSQVARWVFKFVPAGGGGGGGDIYCLPVPYARRKRRPDDDAGPINRNGRLGLSNLFFSAFLLLLCLEQRNVSNTRVGGDRIRALRVCHCMVGRGWCHGYLVLTLGKTAETFIGRCQVGEDNELTFVSNTISDCLQIYL